MSNSISVVLFCLCFVVLETTQTLYHMNLNRKKTTTIERTNEENQEIKKAGGLSCDKILRADFVRSVS